jgi:hypothetical protein
VIKVILEVASLSSLLLFNITWPILSKYNIFSVLEKKDPNPRREPDFVMCCAYLYLANITVDKCHGEDNIND